MAHEKMLEELAARRAKALGMGGPDKLAKRAAQGVLDARSRLDLLLDEVSFVESGLYATSFRAEDRERTPADGKVAGFGRVDGREVGVVFQDHRLLTDRSVFENIALPLVLRGMKRVEIGKRVRSVLDRLGLAARERALPTQLSAGEQQRVGIARAVVGEPRLLVADEPTGNLDPTLSAEIMALFSSLPERGTSVLVASHDLGLVKRMKKRVLVLDHGQLVDDISPEDLADE